MSQTHQLNNQNDFPIAIALLASLASRGDWIGCVISDQSVFSIGSGETAEIDAIAKFSSKLGMATVFCTRMPDEVVVKFMEKCGLRRLVIAKKPPDGHITQASGQLYIEYSASSLYWLRDMVRALEQEAI